MAKALAKNLDIFTLGTASKALGAGERKANQAAEQSRAAATRAQAATKAAEDKAKTDAATMEEENKKKLATSNEESRRSALSNYLAKEGGDTTSRRRFLVGAK